MGPLTLASAFLGSQLAFALYAGCTGRGRCVSSRGRGRGVSLLFWPASMASGACSFALFTWTSPCSGATLLSTSTNNMVVAEQLSPQEGVTPLKTKGELDEVRLEAALGHKQELKRNFGLWSLTSLGIVIAKYGIWFMFG